MKRRKIGMLLSMCIIFNMIFASFAIVKEAKGNATNDETYPTLYVEIHKIIKIDNIEGTPEDGADWYYKIQIISGQEVINVTYNCKGDTDNPTIDKIHNFTVKTELIQIRIKLMEKDFWTGDDLADISGYPGGGMDNNIGDVRGAIYTAFYNLKNNSLWGDPTETLEGWIYTSGELPPDNSTTTDENDAAIQFKIWDNYNPPHANAGPDKTVNVNEIVNFDGSGSTPSNGSLLEEYKWDFNNDGIFDATGEITSHTYTHVGTYTVKLEVTDNLGEKDDDTCIVTVVSTPPEAKFTYSPKSPYTSTTIQFTDISSGYGNIISWHWDFGDGTTSSEQNPTHSYTDDGTYTVTLTVTDEYGKSNSTSKYITVKNVAPHANFVFSPSNPSILDNIQFSDDSTDSDGNIVSWHWNFGDGYTSNLKNPAHKYSQKKTYHVTLTVTDDDGATANITKSITVSNILPIANFVFSPSNPTDLDTITFTDASSDSDGSIVNYTWQFGDGNIAYGKNVLHQYNDNGNYSIKLTVEDNDGATKSIMKSITISNVKPFANFSWKPSNPKEKENIKFNFTGFDNDGYIVNWTWNFGDGNHAYVQNPIHRYSKDGKYKVTLTVEDNDGGFSTYEQEISIGKKLPGFEFIAFIVALLIIGLIKRRR